MRVRSIGDPAGMEAGMETGMEAEMSRYSALLLAVLCATSAPGVVSTVAAQNRASDAGKWEVPRTPDGHPDLQGNWTNMTLTPFERAGDRGPVFTWEEVEELERTSGDCPANPGTVACGRPERTTGNAEVRLSGQEYNEVYWDRGSHIAIVDGEPRASLVTSPANGRRPPLTPEGERRVQENRDFRSQFGLYDHPEPRPLGERCIINGSTSGPIGPPIVPKTSYDGNYTVVQTADHVMIMTEMIHDTRIIRIGSGPRLPAHVRPWMGDSWGHWEGDVLVVETTNFHRLQRFRGNESDNLKVTERFSRVDEETILYEFTVDDPTTYAEPWGGEIPMKALHDRLYEYACHEGNHNLVGILRGARYQERLEARNPNGPR